MKAFYKFRQNLLLVLALSHLLPLLVGLATWTALESYTSLDSQTLVFISFATGFAVAILFFATLFMVYSKAAERLYRHLFELRQRNFAYRTGFRSKGLFGAVADKLNWVSDRFDQYQTSSHAETDILNAETQRLRSVLNSIKDGVFALDKSGHILLFNKAAEQITGFKLANVAGKPVSHIVPMMRGNELILTQWLNQVAGKAIAEQHWDNVRLKTELGKQRAVDVDALYQGADPNGIRTLVTFHDRTEAQEVEDMKLDFVALAAHELRTPITVINGYVLILGD